MNSEELELSLRTEFENYLKSFRAEMREQAAELHRQIEAEMEKHRSLLDQAFQAYAARFDFEQGLDEGFRASVVEHLRQARDAGAALTASAMDEAAEMDKAVAAPADYKGLRDAIADISGQKSQATILKSLVEQAEKFAPRGAFFIIKNEHLEGWKAFGDDNADNVVRDIRFPVSAETILGSAVNSLSRSDGAYGEYAHDASFLQPLNYGQPDRMHAIPLIARGRGVAVLYADYGSSGVNVNVEALETLVSIAGLTVELLASTHTAKIENREMGAADFEEAHHDHADAAQPETSESFQPETREEVAEPEVSHEVETADDRHEAAPVGSHETDFAFTESSPVEEVHDAGSPFAEPVMEEVHEATVSEVEVGEVQPVEEDVAASEPVAEFENVGEVIFDSDESRAGEMPSPFDSAADFEPAGAGVGVGGKKSKKGKEKAAEVSPADVGRATRTDRRVDLPIDVTEEERRPHNDARRFARLLVSEIKLYNEQRVNEGREAGDLYQRLREAIDRSREMYDKRVQPPVAAKFDYFHYEIVNTLADGDENRLGNGYPGSSV